MKAFATAFYCAAVIERTPFAGSEETYCEAAYDEIAQRYTDDDAAVARFSAEVEAGEEALRTFFSVYRIDGEGLSHIVGDFTDREEARHIAALLNRGLRLADTRGALAGTLHQIEQMRGMFSDEDGTIKRALKDGYNILKVPM